MIELDPTLLSRNVASLLMLRGAAAPPLRMQTEANLAARRMLAGLDGSRALFMPKCCVDEAMSAAVRALLYLWHGWPDDCAMHVQVAPDTERHYVTGIRLRQQGRYDAAKQSFRELEGHAIFTPLREYAQVAAGASADPVLKRFGEVLEVRGDWEPFAFIDVFSQVVDGKLSYGADAILRGIQCREIELLLVRCYEGAVGEKLPERRRDEAPVRRRIERKPPRTRTSSEPPSRCDSVVGASPAVAPPAATAECRVRCPRCKAPMSVAQSMRGKPVRCAACQAEFRVPEGGLPGRAHVRRGIGVRCPRCQGTHAVPPTARGQKTVCPRCASSFLVPG